MCKLVFALFIVSVTIAIIYAQKAEKQTKQDEQSLAAKSAEVTVPKTAQAGNPNKTEVAKKSDKPKPTKRPRRPPRRRRPSRRRRPRRRKRPRNQQRSTKPTAKTVTKKTTNKVPQNTKKDAKVNEQNPGPTPKAPVQVNAAIKQNTPIKTEVNQDNTNKMKQVKTETVAKAENNLNNDVPLNNVMQPSQDIKEEVKQRVINEKSEAKPQVQAMKLAQSQADIPKANTELNSGKPNSDNSHSATGVKTSNEIKHKVEKGQMARKITKVENKPKKQIVSAVDKSMAEQEKFFDFFSFTTTEEPVLAAPPDIDPNKKPGKKVLPTVDPSKGVAHDGIPCEVNYKAHPKDKTMYLARLPDDEWQAVDCPPNLALGLVWRQDLCLCGEELIPQDPNDPCGLSGYNPDPNNRHKYIRRHHGINSVMDCPADLVWSQKECHCMHDVDAIRPMEPTVTFVCKTILNLTFENRLKNTAVGYNIKPVKFGRRSKIPRIRFVKTPGANGLAAQIVSQPLAFQAFKGNDFQTQLTLSLNFKITGRRRKSNNFMTLLTDECARAESGVNKQWGPSIMLSFQPSTKTFRLLFRTEYNVTEEDITGALPNNQGWYKVVLYFEDETLNLENNGEKLFTAMDVQGKIPPNKCPLYIAGRGKGYSKAQNFYGYMDNIFLVKDCTFHESNIKIL